MLIASTGLLFYASYSHSNWFRKLALAGIGLTVAKEFLIDVSGLTGLTRVFSFLILGLAVAALAWQNRWFGGVSLKRWSADHFCVRDDFRHYTRNQGQSSPRPLTAANWPS